MNIAAVEYYIHENFYLLTFHKAPPPENCSPHSIYLCRYILDDVDRHWSYHDKDNDGFISLQEYQDTSYGVIEGLSQIADCAA